MAASVLWNGACHVPSVTGCEQDGVVKATGSEREGNRPPRLMPRGRVIVDDDFDDAIEAAVAVARDAASLTASLTAASVPAQPEAPLYQPAQPPPRFLQGPIILQGHIISAEATGDNGTNAPADAKRIARKISEFADEMEDKTFNNWAHKRLHDMSAEVFRLHGVTSSVPEERLAAAERAGAARQRRETEELLQEEMTQVLERTRALRARMDAQREARAQIESNEARAQRENEETQRLEAEAATMRRRVDEATARRERSRAALLELHTRYARMQEEAAELNAERAAVQRAAAEQRADRLALKRRRM